ncbi:hypothetical protein [Pseudooceanicola spongiae]|uniref:Uncharacterized protein n=1 Tax=Pseudooceanicola spongiae TaxID=2613965 RepID=A0A7L9WI05_9RHOB|nr:hypothetical protein [Pseudooceanicola spongiae]QOL80031.1 hypothetical protein F3W81_03840 [Pseudooceanicola spongiae]
MTEVFSNTNSGRIIWREAADNAYFAAVKDANLHLRRFFDPDSGEGGFSFRMTRGDKEVFFIVSDTEEEQQFMGDLYAAAGVCSAGGEAFFNDLFK